MTEFRLQIACHYVKIGNYSDMLYISKIRNLHPAYTNIAIEALIVRFAGLKWHFTIRAGQITVKSACISLFPLL